MKKNIYRILAATFAMAIMVASPTATITTHALGFNADAHDDTDRGKRPSSSDNESSESYTEPSTSSNSGSSDSSDSGSSSSSSNSGSSNSSDSGSSSSSSNSGSSTVSAPKNPNDVVVSVAGGQTFRNVMNADHTTYQVYHCGDSKVTFTVTDAKGNAVAYKTVKLEQGEDKLWYENITFADDVDVKDLTLNVTKGDATYLSTELGVSGIKINGTVVLSTVPAEPETESVVGHRYCATCGASFDIYENSGVDGAWKTHMKEHLAKGEPARYSDK